MTYDPKKAALYNKLIQQGASEDTALAQAGIGANDFGSYAVGDDGKLGSIVAGPGRRAGEEIVVDRGTPARVNYPQTASGLPSQQPGRKDVSYTTTSTTTVSGGGSTTIISGPPQSTTESRAVQPAINAKQAEIDQFIKDNPSNLARRRQGLPPLTPEEAAERQARLNTLEDQRSQLTNQQLGLTNPGPPTVITVPNTTTTTITTTSGRSSTNQPVDFLADEALEQQTEIVIDQRLPSAATRSSTTAPRDDPTAGEAEARAFAQQQSTTNFPEPVDSATNPGYGEEDDPFEPDDRVGITEPVDGISPYGETDEFQDPEAFEAEAVSDTAGYPDVGEVPGVTTGEFGGDPGLLPDQVEAQAAAQAQADTLARANQARAQATLQQRYNQTTQGDWRVRIRLAPGAKYLYASENPGILKPLAAAGGVIFPYMPTIGTSYVANYDRYELMHSNYRGYFYKNSAVNEVTIDGTFTAQDTREAEYLLAVIHFFRSVTKMFYGQDPERGTPPPLVELSGLGQYQFNNHPCLVSNFTYNLPNGVDYIRVNPNNQGLNLTPRQTLTSRSAVPTIDSVINRLANAGLPRGATGSPVDLGAVNQTVSGTGQTTYVPTKMQIQITLLPTQTRAMISQLFSLRDFANGNLLRGGFW